MARKRKDTDYLVISARVKAMETRLLTRERMEQILEARSDEDAAKLLQESGYPEMDLSDPERMDGAIAAARKATLEDLAAGMPDPGFLDVFKLKYDYHNVKAVLKARAMNVDPGHMLMDLGRVPAQALREAVESGETGSLPPTLAEAVAEAREVLDTTQDPQLGDIALDRWYYRELTEIASETGSAFLQGYARLQIDGANLRALVRTLRMGKGPGFLSGVLAEGGSVDCGQLLRAAENGGAGLTEAYHATALEAAAEVGSACLKEGMMTEFEKLCDEAVSDYLSGAQLVPFGEEPLLGYLAARETEYTNLRILLMGRAAGISHDVIRSRLRTGGV